MMVATQWTIIANLTAARTPILHAVMIPHRCLTTEQCIEAGSGRAIISLTVSLEHPGHVITKLTNRCWVHQQWVSLKRIRSFRRSVDNFDLSIFSQLRNQGLIAAINHGAAKLLLDCFVFWCCCLSFPFK